MNIEMTFFNGLDSQYNAYEDYYYHLAEVIFNHLDLHNNFIFEVDLVDQETIHNINRQYRNIDRVTDVISFAFEDDGEFININHDNNFPRDLGEIFICVDKAKMQSEEYHHSFEREMAFLFTHGLLHLLGYDHMKKEDEIIMFKLQDEIMEKMKL